MFYIISGISGILAGMGIGGGSIFILLCNLFEIIELNDAKGYNLIMFITVGIFASLFNIKNKNFDFNLFKKIIIPIIFGSVIGIFIIKNIDQNLLKRLFYAFMLVIGIYEIITSLKSIKKSKNINN